MFSTHQGRTRTDAQANSYDAQACGEEIFLGVHEKLYLDESPFYRRNGLFLEKRSFLLGGFLNRFLLRKSIA
jgi:hypothetical protein